MPFQRSLIGIAMAACQSLSEDEDDREENGEDEGKDGGENNSNGRTLTKPKEDPQDLIREEKSKDLEIDDANDDGFLYSNIEEFLEVSEAGINEVEVIQTQDEDNRLWSANILLRLRNFIKYTRYHHDKWDAVLLKLEYQRKKIRYDVRTRWSSTYLMLKNAIEFKIPVLEFSSSIISKHSKYSRLEDKLCSIITKDDFSCHRSIMLLG
jgi:hypothetical protein